MDLIFLHSAHYPDCTARVGKRFDGYHTLQYMERGSVALEVDGERFALEGAWFWSAYPGPWIGFGQAPGAGTWNHRYVAFQGERVERWRAEGIWLPRPQAALPDREYAARFDALLECARRVDRWGARRAAHLLEGLLIDLAEARQAATPVEPWLETLLARLDGDDPPPDYPALAAEMGMSYSTLRARFREATGTPLHTYVLQRRIAEARVLLGETDLPLKTIAQRLGYGSVYYFSRRFAQVAGVPPGAYRRSRQRRETPPGADRV